MGGFAPESTPSPPPPMTFDSEDEGDNDGDDDDDSDDGDGDASFIDEMSTWQKGRVVLVGYESSHS